MVLLARNLPAEWDCGVYSLGGGPYAGVLAEHSVRLHVHERSWRFDPRPGLGLWRIVARWRPDVVHSWGWMSTLLSGPACRLLRIPLIDGSIRDGMLPHRLVRVTRSARMAATVVVANSSAGLTAWGISNRRARVIYNALDPARLSALDGLLPGRTSSPPEGLTAVMVARMVLGKDFRTVCDAAHILRGRGGVPWSFIFVGDGPDRNALQRYVGALDLAGTVQWVEAGLEPLTVLLASNVGILATAPGLHAEGCANALLEYMACGLPVVCTDDGGNPEVVEQGVNGYLVPARDAVAMADALAGLAADGPLRRRIGAANIEAVSRRFSLDRMVGEYTTLYETLAKGQAL